jgi:hypothetical protein
MADDMKRTLKVFQKGRSSKHTAYLLEVSPICRCRRIVAEGHAMNPKRGKTVLTPGEESDLTARTVRSHSLTGLRVNKTT